MRALDVLYNELECEKEELLHKELEKIYIREQLLSSVKKCLEKMNTFNSRDCKKAYQELREYVNLEELEKVVSSTWGDSIDEYSDRFGLVAINFIKSVSEKNRVYNNYSVYDHPYMWEKLIIGIIQEKQEIG